MKRQLALTTSITDPISGLICNKMRIHYLNNPGADSLSVGWEPFRSSDGQASGGGEISYTDADLNAKSAKTSDGWIDFFLLDMNSKVPGVDLSGTVEDMP